MTIYELYSNALRYGTVSGEVRLELHKCEGGVRVITVNHATEGHIWRLSQHVRRLQRNAAVVYDKELSQLSDEAPRSPMLGLVRVAHEAGLKLELHVQGDRVAVSASPA